MGITTNNAANEAAFHTGTTLSFKGSAETDNGITFGFSSRLDSDKSDSNAFNGWDSETGYIKGAFGTLTMGDTDGAFDRVMGELDFIASITDDHSTHAGFNGNSGLDGDEDDQVLRYDYSFGAFAIAASLEQDDNGASDDDIMGLGVKYTGDMAGLSLTVGVGYQTQDNSANVTGLSLGLDMGNGLEAGLNYSTLSDEGIGGGDVTHTGVGVAYSMDAWAFTANYGQFDRDAAADSDGFGVAVNYDLGGGAVVQFGYGTGEVDGSDSVDSYSLGVAMSF